MPLAFTPPNGGGGVQHVMVDPDAASLHALRDVVGPLGVAAPHAAAKPELGVIGDRDGIIDAVVGDHSEYRPEDLLSGDRVVVIDVGEDRGLHEPAAILL